MLLAKVNGLISNEQSRATGTWNIGILPVRLAEMFSAASSAARLQTRWRTGCKSMFRSGAALIQALPGRSEEDSLRFAMRDRVRFLRRWKTHRSARLRRCKLVRETKWKRRRRFDRPGCADIRSWKQERHRAHHSRAADTMPMDDQTQRRLASRESADER